MYILIILQKNKITTVCIMSQKLIRLTCESNDGVFNGKFDQDIEIKKGSDIAFQSLTLERESSSFTVNKTNSVVQYAAKDIAAETQSATLESRLYEAGDYPILMADMTDQLNKGCNMLTQPQQMNLGWKAVVDEVTDKVKIMCRPSPFFPMTVFKGVGVSGEPVYLSGLVRDAGAVAGAEVETGFGGTGREVDAAGGTQALNECYMFLEKEFTASTGSLRVRIAGCTPGTTDGPAFTIALVDADGLTKLKNKTIAYSDLVYAVQADQVSADPTKGGYSFITAKGSAAVTPTAPFVKIENANITQGGNGDVFEIVRKRGLLQGIIHQQTGGQTALTESAPLSPSSQVLYPVVFFHLPNGGSPIQTNILTAIQVSLDPWQDYTVSGDSWNDYVTANPQINDIRSSLATITLYNPDDISAALLPFEPKFDFTTSDISTFLGFSDKSLVLKVGDDFSSKGAQLEFPPKLSLLDPISGGQYDRDQGFILNAVTVITNAINGDSYLVDTQTFTLDSFDSYGLSKAERDANSGGSRRNLLAAILVTEQDIPNSANARVTYEPNTLDYIAIKNRSDIITRQIRMRLLNARYDTITTAGLAAMTILIREPYTD